MSHYPWQPGAGENVNEHQGCNHRERRANGAPGGFEQQHHTNDRNDDVWDGR